MKQLSPKEYELVALGAALASNCIPCIEYHIPEARKVGLTEGQLREAIALAEKIRQVPARKVLEVANRLAGTPPTEECSQASCGCQTAPT